MSFKLPGDNGWRESLDFVLLGILFGLMAGLGEFGLRWFISVVLHRPSNHDFGSELLWVLPFANVLPFGLAGLLIAIASRRWHGNSLTRAAVAAFGAAAAMALLLHIRSLHAIVSLILSVGVGVRLADLLGARPDRLRRFVRRATMPAVGAVVLMAFATRVTEALKERRALAGAASAPANAPNVLIIVLDAVRAPDLSAYGYARRTSPELERFAERSVLFERAIVTAPWSLTSHASMFTGRYPHEMSANWNVPLDATYPTLAEFLHDRGYATAGFVANRFYGRPDLGLSRGFIHYESRKFDVAAMFATGNLGDAVVRGFNRLTNRYYGPKRIDASEINRRLLSWLPSRGSRPFFVFVNYFDAHEPYVAPPPYDRWFSGTEPPRRRVREGHRHTKEELRGLRDAYDQALAYLDSQLGALLRELERRELLSNTLVVITSDHGEEFGEHGWVSHGNGLYLPSLRVPLLISFPGRVPTGRVVAEPVTLRDLPATVSELLGLDKQDSFPGSSLSSSWAKARDSLGITRSPLLSEVGTPRNAPSWYAVAKGNMESIIVGRHHYIRNGDGREELFDIFADPWETTDLANTQGAKATLDTARRALDSATRSVRRAMANKPSR
jgi:arylsulfatase A-like enzyme